MVFTVFVDNHADILERLLRLKFPNGAKGIDFTFGTGALWWNILENPKLKEMYSLTACDAVPNPKVPEKIVKRNLFTDDYTDLGQFDFALFDPPYVIGRSSFDYSAGIKKGNLVPMQMQGPRSWAADELTKYVSNPTVEVFNDRVKHLSAKAPTILKPNGLLFIKVMDVRHNKHFIPHHINICNILQENFELTDHAIYVRQGATTWKIPNHLQNLHGHWLIFQLKETR